VPDEREAMALAASRLTGARLAGGYGRNRGRSIAPAGAFRRPVLILTRLL
jgi:hypothetical protein